MASINTRLNIEKLDGNIVQMDGGSKQVGFKQLGPGVETGVHGVHDEKRVWFEVELQGAQRDREADRSTQQCTKSGVAKHLGVAGLQQQNGLVKETNVTLLAKVVLYRNMGFNESGEYKKTFIGSGVGTGSMQVLQGVEFEVEPQEDLTFEVEPHGNVDHVVGSHEVQTQNLIYYHPARDREQYLARELFEYREDSNEAAFIVAAVENIYAHESLNFNDTVACEVISKWNAGLKDYMDARSDVYVLNNGCKKYSDDSDGYYWESTPGDCDVEKNGKWSCIYAVGSQEYQMVCTRLDIASADVGMLDKFDRGLQTDVQVFVDFDYAMAAYMTLTGSWKKKIWLKGLMAESGYELSLVAGIATGALVKGGSRSEVPAQVEGAAYRY
ncbi:hypothetical protein Tco_0892825 [Tanacetum coccineum]|uniref:Zinc finger, CCHC-type n=1 Tax=Tanacetum coccineum TaxID=301880 RepID=A0ABQ5CA52_9ASTR